MKLLIPQDGAPQINNLRYKWLHYGLWQIYIYLYLMDVNGVYKPQNMTGGHHPAITDPYLLWIIFLNRLDASSSLHQLCALLERGGPFYMFTQTVIHLKRRAPPPAKLVEK